MFLFRVIDLLALIGLLVQAFLAWVFVAVFFALKRPRPLSGALRSFHRAFAVLAVALTLMSVRFFRAHDAVHASAAWEDGALAPTLVYSAYMGLKVCFVWLIFSGCRQLVDRRTRPALRGVAVSIAALFAAAPFLIGGIDALLVLQAPVMIVGSLAALHALKDADLPASGSRVVRWSLISHAGAWTLHAAAVLLSPHLKIVLSLNSFLDLGVQLMLGIGLIICVLQSAHARLLAAEQDREQLRETIYRDRKLRALGTIVSGVAHELNNPLTVVLGYAELLRRADPESRGVRIIAEQAERCRGIVRNLSALAGQSVHPREQVDVEALARRVVRGLSPRVLEGGRSVRVEAMGGLRCSADRIGLEQVLANLVQNGLHASPPGGTVTVSGRTAGTEIDLTVSDTGHGIPPERRERLFEPFFTTKPPGEGTGLGLSIAHAIVRGHDGSIAIEDGPGGRGVTFRIRIPAAPDAAAAPRPPAEPPARHGGRLLVIDDEPSLREILCEQARHNGWQVSAASSAEEALAGAIETADAVLCDLRMPGIGGMGLHDRLLESRPELLSRVVFFTGDPASPESLAFSRRCARPLLQKPFELDELFSVLAGAAGLDAEADTIVPLGRARLRVP